MAKNQPQAPLVTSVSSTLKKSIQSDTQVCSAEEIKEKKQNMMEVLDKSLEIFKDNLMAGKVSMNTSADLERLVKLQLLISGEADSRVGKPYGEIEQETTEVKSSSVSMSKIEEILNLDDKDVKNMYNKLYEGYNKVNDIDV